MAGTKKLDGTLNVLLGYEDNGVEMITNHGDEYNEGFEYLPGDVCTHEKHIYRCLAATTGTWDDECWQLKYGGSITLGKSYSPESAGTTVFQVATATMAYDVGGADVITMTYASGSEPENNITKFADWHLRSVIWPSLSDDLGLFVNVGFHDIIVDKTQTGTVTTTLSSTLCAIVISEVSGTGTTVTIAFTQAGASMYTLLKAMMQGGQYEAVALMPVLANIQ